MAIRDDLPAAMIPSFTPAPEPKTLDDGTLVTPGDTRQVGAPPESRSSMFGRQPSPRPEAPAAPDTRTPSSSAGSRIGDPKQAAKVLGGLVGLVFVVGGGLLVQLRGRDLRRPTRQQTAGIADPVARILARHTDLSMLTPDLGDVIEAGSAIGDYLTDGPMVVARDQDQDQPVYLDDAEQDPDPEPLQAPTDEVRYLD